MKELSIEEKAKRYDEAIEKAKNCLKDGTITNTAISYIETILPELKESEDERIMACIGMCLTDIDEQRFADFNTNLKECRAWLEKQGEQKPAFDIDIPFGAKDSELIKASYYIPEGFHAEIEGNHVVIKKGEQKSAWSEEDEAMWVEISDLLWEGYKQSDSTFSWDDIRNWVIPKLKFLKDRVQPQNTWKPSGVQMAALNSINVIGSISYPWQGQELINLYQDLKKLREE